MRSGRRVTSPRVPGLRTRSPGMQAAWGFEYSAPATPIFLISLQLDGPMDWTFRAIMLAALATGWLLFRRQPRPANVRTWELVAIALGAFCGGMIGAKLPFVLSDWEGFLSGRAWLADGKTILAGLVGGYFGAEVTEWALGIHTKMCDSFAMPLAAGVGIGRLGCFHAGCCQGAPTSLPLSISVMAWPATPRNFTRRPST